MIDSTGDFLGQRVKKDVFPLAFGYLTKHCNTSLKGGPMYRFSPTCKQQTQLLILIASAIEKLGLSNEILWKTGVVCSGYLDCRQPMLLQIVSNILTRSTQFLNALAVSDTNLLRTRIYLAVLFIDL